MNHNEDLPFRGEDIPLIKLKKTKCRDIKPKAFAKLRSTIENIGLLEPLLVSPREDGCYNILAGESCFDVMMEMGMETAPCMIRNDADIYTSNYQVNHLSPVEAAKMIKKAMEVVDGQLIADVFGLKRMIFRLPEALLNRLHPTIIKACDNGTITRACARELAEVVPVRQLEIFAMMQNTKNFGTKFVKKQLLMTPQKKWQSKRKTPPLEENRGRKKSLGTKLQADQAKQDQLKKLFREYTSALMLIVIHSREIITNNAIEKYLKTNMMPIYTEIKAIIESELIEKKAPR
jgi:ParB-like chromosome segregation protein Spo0J